MVLGYISTHFSFENRMKIFSSILALRISIGRKRQETDNFLMEKHSKIGYGENKPGSFTRGPMGLQNDRGSSGTLKKIFFRPPWVTTFFENFLKFFSKKIEKINFAGKQTWYFS